MQTVREWTTLHGLEKISELQAVCQAGTKTSVSEACRKKGMWYVSSVGKASLAGRKIHKDKHYLKGQYAEP